MDAHEPDFGAFAPGPLDRFVLSLTEPLPDNRAALRLAILLRRAVTMRLKYPDGALDVERWGMKLRLHPRDNGCEKNLLFTPKMYEPVELHELKSDAERARHSGRPFVFVDIGANVGLFSLFVAASAKPGTRILAFEPSPGSLQRLYFNIRANPGIPIEVFPIALSDEPGTLRIRENRRDRGGTSTEKIEPGGQAPDAASVAARTLLDVLTGENIQSVNALKIDVEQFEDRILAPFFRDAPPGLWPELVIIEDTRLSWKTDLIAMMEQRAYALVTRTSHLNLILRRRPR